MLEKLQAIDATAIEELRTLKSEQDTLQERLGKLEQRRGAVSEPVFERVRSDYESRLEALEDRAQPLREQARTEFAKLVELLDRMAAAVEGAQLDCEELNLRHELGELEEEPFEHQIAEARETLQRCESELEAGASLKESFLSAVRNEDELRAPDEPEVSDAARDETGAPPDDDSLPGDDDLPCGDDLPGDDDHPGDKQPAQEREPIDAVEPLAETEPTAAEDPASPAADDADADDAKDSKDSKDSGDSRDTGPADAPAAVPPDESGADEMTAQLDTGSTAELGGHDAPSRTLAFDPFEPDESMLEPVAKLETEPVGDLETVPVGEPTQMFEIARLISAGPGERGSEHRLNPTMTTIGRAPGNDIRIDDPSVSRRHARIDMGKNGFTVVDLGAENGVFVNHNRITERLLADGDLIELGPGGRAFVFRSA